MVAPQNQAPASQSFGYVVWLGPQKAPTSILAVALGATPSTHFGGSEAPFFSGCGEVLDQIGLLENNGDETENNLPFKSP